MTQHEVEAFLQNLQLLGYKPSSTDFFTNLKFFETSQKSEFEKIVLFLFRTLDAAKAHSIFNNCIPCINHQRSQEFRTGCVNWWKSIAHQHPNLNLPKVSGIVLKDLRGPAIAQLMLHFSMFVLRTETERLSGEPCMQFIPPCSGVLSEIQKTTITAAANAEFKEFIHLTQVVQKEEENLKSFVEQHVKSYRETSKKIEELRVLRNKLLENEPARKMTPSKRGKVEHSFTETDYNIARKTLHQTLSTNRKMNEKLSSTLAEIQHGQDVINLIKKETENGKISLNAVEINACVPSVLVQKHTTKVYEKIGKSLYTDGLLNLQSMLGLFNLSLSLLNEKLHLVGLPNFESELQSVQAQNHIQSKNQQMLTNIDKNLHSQTMIMHSRILQLKHQMKSKINHETTKRVMCESKSNVSPQKFPWSSTEQNLKFTTPSKNNAESPIPLASYGVRSNLIHVPSPVKNAIVEMPKPIPVSKFIEKTRTLQDYPKTHLRRPRKKDTSAKPKNIHAKQTAVQDQETALNVAKEKSSAERAMSELASSIVKAVVLETPTPKIKYNGESKFDISNEISDKAFRSASLLHTTPPNFNDSVFTHEATPTVVSTSELSGSRTAIFQGNSVECNNKENECRENESMQNASQDTIIFNDATLINAECKKSTVNSFNTPLSAVSINSRYFRTQSQVTTTDESEVEKTPFHVWKNHGEVISMDMSLDLLNFEIPDDVMNQSDEETPGETLTSKKQEENSQPLVVPIANLLDFSIQDLPDNNENEQTKIDLSEDVCLIDFST